MLLLDTNVWIDVIRGRRSTTRGRLEAARADGVSVFVSTIVWFELWRGALKSDRPSENAEHLRRVTATYELLPMHARDAEAAAEIQLGLARQGLPIGPYDLLIAAQALTRGLTVVTGNVREFTRIPDLDVEDWLA